MTELHHGRTNGNGHKLKQWVSDLRQHIFTQRTFKPWKKLPRGYPERLCSLLPRGLEDWIKPWATWSDFIAEPALNGQLYWRPLELSSNLIILLCDSSLCFWKGIVKNKIKQNILLLYICTTSS